MPTRKSFTPRVVKVFQKSKDTRWKARSSIRQALRKVLRRKSAKTFKKKVNRVLATKTEIMYTAGRNIRELFTNATTFEQAPYFLMNLGDAQIPNQTALPQNLMSVYMEGANEAGHTHQFPTQEYKGTKLFGKYIRSSLRLDMPSPGALTGNLNTSQLPSQYQYRLIIFSAKRVPSAINPNAGSVPDPSTNLFKDAADNNFGFASLASDAVEGQTGPVAANYWTNPDLLNKKFNSTNYTKHYERKGYISVPLYSNTAPTGASQHVWTGQTQPARSSIEFNYYHKVNKNLLMNLDKEDTPSGVPSVPFNYNSTIMIFCTMCPVGINNSANIGILNQLVRPNISIDSTFAFSDL